VLEFVGENYWGRSRRGRGWDLWRSRLGLSLSIVPPHVYLWFVYKVLVQWTCEYTWVKKGVGGWENHETGNPARCSDSVREHKLSTGAAHRSLKFTSAPDGVNRLKEPPVISHTKERWENPMRNAAAGENFISIASLSSCRISPFPTQDQRPSNRKRLYLRRGEM